MDSCDKRVNILISTYNGEKYIVQQLESIRTQTYSNIKIYIRDDGSVDNTINVIKNYISLKNISNIVLIKGHNVGFGRSFMRLLKQAEDGDYWAFCDQDDVWEEKRVEKAVEWFNNNLRDIPQIYCDDYIEVDENLNKIEGHKLVRKNYNFIRSITDVAHMGFVETINSTMRDYMLMTNMKKINSHDHLAEMIGMEFGEIFESSNGTTLHRRLSGSVSSLGMSARIKWLLKAFKGENEITPQAREFYYTFGSKMNQKNKTVLEWFVNDRYCFKNSIKKACYLHRWRPMMSSEIICRGLMLMGKI